MKRKMKRHRCKRDFVGIFMCGSFLFSRLAAQWETQIGVIKAVVFRDAKELKDDPSIHLAAAAAAAAAAYGRHSVNR